MLARAMIKVCFVLSGLQTSISRTWPHFAQRLNVFRLSGTLGHRLHWRPLRGLYSCNVGIKYNRSRFDYYSFTASSHQISLVYHLYLIMLTPTNNGDDHMEAKKKKQTPPQTSYIMELYNNNNINTFMYIISVADQNWKDTSRSE